MTDRELTEDEAKVLVDKVSARQKAIDANRAAMATEIVEGQNIQTVEEGRRFAHAWIVTAAQHASNEEFYRKQRDVALEALQRIQKMGRVCASYEICDHAACDDSALAAIEAGNAIRDMNAVSDEISKTDAGAS